MAIVQSLVALITRSLGRIVSALFGWAVMALFGQTSAREKLWLSGLVGAAAAWPILLAGVIWPRIGTLVLAFAPLPRWIPAWLIRLAWIALAIAVPFALGITVATRARGPVVPIPGTAPERRRAVAPQSSASPLRERAIVKLLRGFPITVAIAISFVIVFVTVPWRRLMNTVRRRVDVFVPLVTDTAGYEEVARGIAETLARHGFDVSPAEPSWEITAPASVLLRLGGPSFRGYVPEHYARFRGPDLDIVLYPTALYVTGAEMVTARAHGLLTEAMTTAPAYQTFDPGAQDIERQIRSVWAAFRQNPAAHVGARALRGRLDEISREIGDLAVDYEQWQVVYRQALQLDRALRGERQLLEINGRVPKPDRSSQEVTEMAERSSDQATEGLSLKELVREISAKTALLARKEVELARAEIKADLQSEIATAKGLGVAALLLLFGINLLLVAAVFAMTAFMPGWLAALILGGVLIVIGGIVGYVSWARRVDNPLSVTRKSFRETVQWVKERLA